MNLKKGLSLVAFGFLFTLVNLNLTFNGSMALTGTAAVLGVAALVAAIVTMVTLFKLKREIAEKTERMD